MALTDSQERQKEKQMKYWKDRETEQLKHYITEEAAYQKQIEEIYNYMMNQIQKEITQFYAKYAVKEGITMAEAKKRVSKLDMEEYERKAKKYVKEKDFSDQANEEMRLYNATMKINRLELLKANIGLELVDGFNDLQKYFDTILTDRTLEEFERQAGILGKSIQDNAQAAHAIVNASFANAEFSDRIWMYQDLMKAELSNLLQVGLIQGRNPKALSGELVKKFNVSRKNAERLMRTELARVQTEAQKQSLERNGYEEYQFHALGTACGICKDLDGKHFKIKDMEIAVNAPPCHPNCRCSCSVYVDREEFEKWLESVEKTDKNDTIKSGARSGARNPDSKEAKEHAIRYYGLVRSMTTDVTKIAKNTGYSESEIQDVKNHIFMEKHDLGGDEPEYFEPDFMMAESWRRLMNNEAEPHDIIMIKHELMEKELMNRGMSQDEAHIITTKKYNYDKEANEFYDKIEKYKEK